MGTSAATMPTRKTSRGNRNMRALGAEPMAVEASWKVSAAKQSVVTDQKHANATGTLNCLVSARASKPLAAAAAAETAGPAAAPVRTPVRTDPAPLATTSAMQSLGCAWREHTSLDTSGSASTPRSEPGQGAIAQDALRLCRSAKAICSRRIAREKVSTGQVSRFFTAYSLLRLGEGERRGAGFEESRQPTERSESFSERRYLSPIGTYARSGDWCSDFCLT